MVRTTRLTKQDDGIFRIEIPDEYISEMGWRDGHILKIGSDKNKLVIEKLSGFMGV